MEIKDLMNPSVVTIEPTSSASLAARLKQEAEALLSALT